MPRLTGSASAFADKERQNVKGGVGFEVEHDKKELILTRFEYSFLSAPWFSLSIWLSQSHLIEGLLKCWHQITEFLV